uniref:Uncharacterized protein n=1 Tax=Glossina austeni TaxID=7395 RepID=A0A1A9UIW7_GLOAU
MLSLSGGRGVSLLVLSRALQTIKIIEKFCLQRSFILFVNKFVAVHDDKGDDDDEKNSSGRHLIITIMILMMSLICIARSQIFISPVHGTITMRTLQTDIQTTYCYHYTIFFIARITTAALATAPTVATTTTTIINVISTTQHCCSTIPRAIIKEKASMTFKKFNLMAFIIQ